MAFNKNQNITVGAMPRCKEAMLVPGKEFSISGVVNLHGPAGAYRYFYQIFCEPLLSNTVVYLPGDDYLQV